MHSVYVNWEQGRIKCTWIPGAMMPPVEQVTSIHGVCFWQGEILLVELPRGVHFPGGHIEPGETPEACLAREVLEEGYVRCGAVSLLGQVVVDHRENPSWQPGGQYPLVGYQLFYRVEVAEVLPYAGDYEASGRRFVSPAAVPQEHTNWNSLLQHLLDAALAGGSAATG